MAPNAPCGPRIGVSALPDISKDEMDFLDSSFFQSGESPKPQLPPPASIVEKYGSRGGALIVRIEEQNMIIKIDHKSYLRLEEAQAMCAIRKAFPNGEIPVPEVFGWRRHDDHVFLYMSIIHGKTLRQAWPLLTVDDKRSIHEDLARITDSLKRIVPYPPGMIGTPPIDVL